MPRYFTHYWMNSTCRLLEHELEGERLVHTAGNLFVRRKLGHGDIVYIVTVRRGTMFLIARMKVDRIVTKREAQRILKEEVWDASDHLIGRRASGTSIRFDLQVPLSVSKALRFVIKTQHNTSKAYFWKTNSFLRIAHEYLFIMRKPRSQLGL